ncbi:MAG: hypothetical protein ACK5ZG_08775 [Phycisphaerae bacterium]|jgi:hypothetical protein
MHAIVMHSTQPWPANARASIDAAAARWTCDVRVFDFPYAPHPSWARLELAKHLRDYDRVLVLDPDVFISQDCPNIFALAPRTHVCMAMELQSLEDRIGPYPWNGALAQWRNHLGRRVSIERHLQGGVCLYSPQLHWQTFEKLLGWWNMHGRFSHAPIYEQPMWHEVGERLFHLPIRRMSRLVNRHTRKQHELPQHYIMHLTGGDKARRIAETNWRAPAQEPLRLVKQAAGANAAMQERLLHLLQASLFHEAIVVQGAELMSVVALLAQTTAGSVTWVCEGSVDASRCTQGEGAGRVRVARGDAKMIAMRARATLLVRTGDDALPAWQVLEAAAERSPVQDWWRRANEPHTPLGVVRRRVARLLE